VSSAPASRFHPPLHLHLREVPWLLLLLLVLLLVLLRLLREVLVLPSRPVFLESEGGGG